MRCKDHRYFQPDSEGISTSSLPSLLRLFSELVVRQALQFQGRINVAGFAAFMSRDSPDKCCAPGDGDGSVNELQLSGVIGDLDPGDEEEQPADENADESAEGDQQEHDAEVAAEDANEKDEDAAVNKECLKELWDEGTSAEAQKARKGSLIAVSLSVSKWIDAECVCVCVCRGI